MSVTLADLLVDHPKPVTAYPDEPVTVAMERMLEHDYSQLPVVVKDEPSQLVGMISTTSIARATLHLRAPQASLRVHHACDGRPTTAKVSDELWDTLDDVREGQPVIVLRADGGIEGLLTAHDFTAYLRRLAEDSVLVADIETAVKQLILRHFQGADEKLKSAVDKQVRGQHSSLLTSVRKVVTACLSSAGADPQALSAPAYKAAFDEHLVGKVEGEFDKLTFLQFNAIFFGECWSTYGGRFELPIESLRKLLDDARDLRNMLAHHRGTLSSAQRDRLTFCRDIFNRVADLTDVATPAPIQTERPAPANAPEAAPPGGEVGERVEQLTTTLRGTEGDRLVLGFEAVAGLLAEGLPPSASANRSWWDNDEEKPQAAAWLDADWRVVSVNLTNRTVTFARNTGRARAYIAAFGAIFRRLAATKAFHKLPSPAGRNWQEIAYLPEGGAGTARVVLSFASRRRFRVELYIDCGDAIRNKAAFDALQERADELAPLVGTELEWERLDDRQACRVAAYVPGGADADDEEADLERLAQWVADVAPKFYAAMRKHYRSATA